MGIDRKPVGRGLIRCCSPEQEAAGREGEVGMGLSLRKSGEADASALPDPVAASIPTEYSDATWRLHLLAALHAKSLVTDEEFEVKRAKILASV
jgi:hypothetical protein